MTETLAAVFILGGAVSLTYGLLDILSPSTTIRWQVRSTAKHGGVRRATGDAVQRAMGFDSAIDPGSDPAIRRNVRWIGLALVTIGVGALIVGISIWGRS